jgi:hypothetical protein
MVSSGEGRFAVLWNASTATMFALLQGRGDPAPDPRRESRDEEGERPKAKVGELRMVNELLREKIRLMETGRPLAWRRSRP